MPLPPHLFLPILVAAASLGLLASSIYIPSIPDIAQAMDVPVGLVQLTITTFLAAYGVSMLVIGPLSDRFGRRRVMLGGTLLCLVASVACALASDIEVLLIGRAVQALGACTGVVIARAMVRDRFDGVETARAMAALATVVTIVPVLAPVAGGYLQVWLGWRASFIVVAFCAAALYALMTFWLPETNNNLQNQHGLFHGLGLAFTTLLQDRRFIAYALVTGCGGAAYYSFSAAAPIIFIERFGISPDLYGIYSASSSVGFMIGGFVSNRLSRRLHADKFIYVGAVLQVAAGLLAVWLALAGFASPWAVVPSLLLMGTGNGFYMPAAYAGGVSVQPHLAGAAAGLAGFMQMLGAVISTMLMAASPLETAAPMGFVIAGAGLVITCGFRALARPAPAY